VFYQMLSGRLPFTGATMIELSSSILKDPAPPLPPNVPAPLRAIVDRCLRKRPEERYQNAGEVRAALGTLPAADVTRRKWLWGAGTAAALGAGAMQTWLFDIKGLDPVTFVVAPLVLGLAALLASYIPARRAARISPLAAMGR